MALEKLRNKLIPADLDAQDVSSWPGWLKHCCGIVLLISLLLVGYWFILENQQRQLKSLEQQEVELKQQFKSKYLLSVFLPQYQEQVAELELRFSRLLKMLPSQNEMPELIDDLTYIATESGLDIVAMDWQQPLNKGFYMEFPIRIRLVGNYHQLGGFIAGVAKLSRIVSIHDLSLEKQTGVIEIDIEAKTYRFIEGQSIEKGES